MKWSKAVVLCVSGCAFAQSQTVLSGAGATFPYPLYAKWFETYSQRTPTVRIPFEPIGSEAGFRKLLAGKIDFAASDSPNLVHELAGEEEERFLLLPTVAGAVAPIVNLPGFTGEISFTPEVLAGIYLGKITKWNDPAIKASNHGVRLPDIAITVVHRKDGSGTSFAFCDFLSRTSAEWKNAVGASHAPNWPVGRGAEGNEGVASLVKEFGGAIGYVEYIYALEHHLTFGRVRNRSGEFVAATVESVGAAAGHARPNAADDFEVSIVDSAETGAYPIATLTWLIVPRHVNDAAKRIALVGFLNWMLGPGQRQAASLGYVALPKELVSRELDAIGRLQ